jgi:hypothetical protein
MGAATSFDIDTQLDIYISYSESSPYVENLSTTLQGLQYKILDSSVIKNTIVSRPSQNETEEKISLTYLSKKINIIIEKTIFIFVCISPNMSKSVNQAMEIDELMKINNKNPNIIYFMTDPNYTPVTNKEINAIIKDNKWYPLYDDASLLDTTNQIITYLNV